MHYRPEQPARVERVIEYVNIPTDVNEQAWRVAKKKLLERYGHRPQLPTTFLGELERVKELVISGNPTGTY